MIPSMNDRDDDDGVNDSEYDRHEDDRDDDDDDHWDSGCNDNDRDDRDDDDHGMAWTRTTRSWLQNMHSTN